MSDRSLYLDTVRWHFRMAWSLLDTFHLPRLTDDRCLWAIDESAWTVRCAPDGTWTAD